MKIAMLTSECNPLYKVGGLADVVYSLSKKLIELGDNVVIVVPYYKNGSNHFDYEPKKICEYNIFMSWRKQYVGLYEYKTNGVTFYLIDNEFYFKRDTYYGWGDDAERYAFFSMAAVEALMAVKFRPDVLHVHDWQVGMVPCYIKERIDSRTDFYHKTKTVLTIHNPAFKGMMDKYCLNNYYGLNDRLFDNGIVRFDGQVSTLKSAIAYSNIITTVSPTYRDELLNYSTSQGFKYCLELRKDDFYGIVNGLDIEEFDPKTDPFIHRQFNPRSYILGKKQCKADVLSSLGLSPKEKDKNNPLVSMVTRLYEQKGMDLVVQIIPELVQRNCFIAILGSGDPYIQQRLEKLRDKYPNNIALYLGFNNHLAHKLYAGSDLFLMPSLFEPCGIGQMIAQRYGTLPIVRETGGLKDTVVGYNPISNNVKKANGFSFIDYDLNGLRYACNVALDTYYNNVEAFRTIIHNAINLDRGWENSAKKYQEIYRKALLK